MVRLIKHEPVPNSGSYEVRFSDGRESVYFYWDVTARLGCTSGSRAIHPRLPIVMWGGDFEVWNMPQARDGFDAIAVVVDWVDACKQRRLDDLLDLYDHAAIVECCESGSFSGRSELRRYWNARLAKAVVGAFEIDVLMPDKDGALVDYRSYDGQPVRTIFKFTDAGKIRLTACAPIRAAA